MARKSKIQKHGSVNKPDMRNNVSPSAPPAEEEYKVGPGRPPKEYQCKPGQSGNPKGAKRKKRSLIPELKEQFERVFSQKLKVTQGDRQRFDHQVGGRPGAAFHSICQGGPACASRCLLDFAEKLGVDLLTSTKASDDTLSADRQAILDAYVDAANAGKGLLCVLPCACAPRAAR